MMLLLEAIRHAKQRQSCMQHDTTVQGSQVARAACSRQAIKRQTAAAGRKAQGTSSQQTGIRAQLHPPTAQCGICSVSKSHCLVRESEFSRQTKVFIKPQPNSAAGSHPINNQWSCKCIGRHPA
jgi:hypothetical protein